MNSSFSEERLLDLVCKFDEMIFDGKSAYFDIDELEELIDHHLILSDYDDAAKVIDYGLPIHSDNPSLLGRRAKLMIYQGHYDEAFSFLDSIVSAEI